MSVRRRFLSAAHQRLLHQLLSGWHRRGTSLLQIGLGSGFSPEFFWQAGFDVTAVDPSPERIAAVREQTGPKIEYVCGHADHLPFDDGAFDCAVLLHHGLTSPCPAAGAACTGGLGAAMARPSATPAPNASDAGASPVLAEALRAASRGVILLEWNRLSLGGVPRTGLTGHTDEQDADAFLLDGEGVDRAGQPAPKGVWPWSLLSLLRRTCPDRRIRLFSVLPLWQAAWPADDGGPAASVRKALASFNLTPVPLPCGALLGLRVDSGELPLTPVGMLRTAAESLYAAKTPREEAIGRSGMQAVAPAPCSPHERKEP